LFLLFYRVRLMPTIRGSNVCTLPCRFLQSATQGIWRSDMCSVRSYRGARHQGSQVTSILKYGCRRSVDLHLTLP